MKNPHLKSIKHLEPYVMVRLKTRYLVVEATGTRKLTIKKEDIAALIRESITKSYGDFGSGLSQYAFQGERAPEYNGTQLKFDIDVYFVCCAVLYYNPQTRLAAIRCAREMCKMVETSLVFVTDLHNQDVNIRVARVCGSSRTCRDHLLKFSLERATALDLYAAQPNFDEDARAEIARIDPQ
ncbi:Ribonuclease P/MRP protein subunit POP5 [Phytophthora citrophthora]|uniref:Ribonuclease P/MRP protein subunit POP5 n=1 Tax=Phytophthora citrophthora TaxID=4793 RepID=A0AAD9LN78_9STRA|nr:Ribonuclease P/MRP protein subunit POP5 [Phytophthora citrophthora]